MRKRKNFFTKSMNGVMVAILIINIILIQYYGQQKKFYEERMQQLEQEYRIVPTYNIGEKPIQGRYYIFFVGNSEARREAFLEALKKQEEMRKNQMRQVFDSIAQEKEEIPLKEFLGVE